MDISFGKSKIKAQANRKTEKKLEPNIEKVKREKRKQREKREQERAKQQKKIQREEQKKQKVQEKQDETIQDKQTIIFRKFFQKIKTDYNVACMSVYVCENGVIRKFVGEPLENNVVIEQYSSFSHTVVISSPVGLQDNLKFKSRFITNFKISETSYMICLSSYAFETFRNSQKITDKINKLIRKLGDIQNELTVGVQQNSPKTV